MSYGEVSSPCKYDRCAECPIPKKNSYENTRAAEVVDISLDWAEAIDGIVTAAELGGIVRERASDRRVTKLQGYIAGAAVLALSGGCSTRTNFQMNKLVKEIE